jgi:hypothetical protein
MGSIVRLPGLSLGPGRYQDPISRSRDGLKHRGTESTGIGEIAESGENVGERERLGWLRFRSEGCGFNYRNRDGVRVVAGPLVAAGRGSGIEKAGKKAFLRCFSG